MTSDTPAWARATIKSRHSDLVAAREYFEVGILPAPEHEFRVQVIENSPEGVSSSFVPLAQFGDSKPDVWSLEFASSTKHGISLYQNGPFDRKRGVGDQRDFRWAVDLEGREFYDRQLPTKTNRLGLILRVASGEFYTNRKTSPLMLKKGDGTFQYFGSAAEEVAADVSLENGDLVLRSAKRGEILRLKEKADTAYEIVIENAPIAQHHMASNPNHFQYYYRLIAKPKAEWYEFKAADAAMSSAGDSSSATFTLASYLVPDTTRVPCMPAGVGKRARPLR